MADTEIIKLNEEKPENSVPNTMEDLTASLKEVINLDENTEEMLDSLIRLLSMPDDEFAILAPSIMQNYQQSLNNPDDKLMLVQNLNANGMKAEDLMIDLESITKEIEDSPISREKRDFLIEMVASIVNVINDTEGIAKRIVPVAIEFCNENAKRPEYAHISDAGADVYAIEDVTIEPGETKIVPLGIKLAPPPGYAVLIHPRSGLSARTKMRIANSIGLCDQGYRDEYGIIIENIDPKIKDISYTFDEKGEIHINSILHGSPIEIGKGQRIGQLRLVEVPKMSFYEVKNILEVDKENRKSGFGGTGDF